MDLKEKTATEDPLLENSQSNYGANNVNPATADPEHWSAISTSNTSTCQCSECWHRNIDLDNDLNNDLEADMKTDLEAEFALKTQAMEQMYAAQEAALKNVTTHSSNGASAISVWLSKHKITKNDEMLQVMSEIGIEHPDDMSELDDDDVEAICSTLTKIGAKRFRVHVSKI